MKIDINNEKVTINRKRLREWLELESLKNKIQEKQNRVETIYQYLNLGTDKEDWENVFWLDAMVALVEIQGVNKISHRIPMIFSSEKPSEVPWDYPKRTFYAWANTFAEKYGWSLAEIENLDPDDACALLQEIYVSEQLEREFFYSLSEVAYHYNKETKKSKFKPLNRPVWMRPKTKKVKKHKFLKSMLPMGEIINLGEITDEMLESTGSFQDA